MSSIKVLHVLEVRATDYSPVRLHYTFMPRAPQFIKTFLKSRHMPHKARAKPVVTSAQEFQNSIGPDMHGPRRRIQGRAPHEKRPRAADMQRAALRYARPNKSD
jgi:hypothetical protein